MSARPKPLRKTYPAKPAAGARKTPLPAVLAVEVVCHNGFHVAARGKAESGHSAAYAVAKLANRLGYNAHADVRYVRTDENYVEHFEIVQVVP